MAQSLSPKRRFLSALFGGRRGDRPPVGNPTSIVTLELMEKTGIYFPQAHLDPMQMAELAAAGHGVLGFDAIMPEFSVQQEAAALGCEMDWGSPSMMPDAKTHPFQKVEDLKIPVCSINSRVTMEVGFPTGGRSPGRPPKRADMNLRLGEISLTIWILLGYENTNLSPILFC